MPRVKFATYHERRAKLLQEWQCSRSVFLALLPQEQWLLHEYYRFAESLTQDQLHQHWSDKRDSGSSLPQRAGRAYAAFEQAFANKPSPVKPQPALPAQRRTCKRGVKVKVASIVRPEPDIRKISGILLGLLDDFNGK